MSVDIPRLLRLQQDAKPLETEVAERTEQFKAVGEHAENFIQQLADKPVYSPPGERKSAFQAFQLSSLPMPLDEVLSVIGKQVDSVGQNLGSSGFMAYIPSGGLYVSALADYLAAVTNRYAGVSYASPGSARMEESLLRWLAGVVGYPDTAEGDLTSGGSMATLSAVVAAREAHAIRSKDVPHSVVYMSSQTHHSFLKALNIIGLQECIVRQVQCDDAHRMDSAALSKQVKLDCAAGLSPWLVAATAGTTNIGAVDPLEEIADIASANNMWFHVDAAYGGAFMLCEDGRDRLKGIERSDSMVLDPHKGFFLPCGVGVVLVRDGSKLFDAYHARGDYMQDMFHAMERSPCDVSPELTRPFRALRFWLPFKMLGTAPFVAALEEKLLLARYFYEQLESIEGMERGPAPDLSIVTFRYLPQSGSVDDFNKALVDAIRDDGRIFLTSTTMNDHYIIRLAVLGHVTHLATIDTALLVLKEKIAVLNTPLQLD